MEKIKQNIPLVVGIAIPILMVMFVAGAIYIPRLFIDIKPPQYDFLYVSGDNNNYYDYPGFYSGRPYPVYAVIDDKLVMNDPPPPPKGYSGPDIEQPAPKLFLHDVSENKSRKVSFEEAVGFTLDSSYESPDGFEVTHGRNNSDFLFFSSYDYDSWYIVKDFYSEKLDLQTGGQSTYYNFHLLGWIVK